MNLKEHIEKLKTIEENLKKEGIEAQDVEVMQMRNQDSDPYLDDLSSNVPNVMLCNDTGDHVYLDDNGVPYWEDAEVEEEDRKNYKKIVCVNW